MLITHHNKTFKNEHIILNDHGFVNCRLVNCILECVNDGETSVILVNVDIVEPEFVGSGWPYAFIEKYHESGGLNFDWTGPLGNDKQTKH